VSGAPGLLGADGQLQPWTRYPQVNFFAVDPEVVGLMSCCVLRAKDLTYRQGFAQNAPVPRIRFALQIGEGDCGEPEAYGVWAPPALGLGGRVVQVQGLEFAWVAIHAAIDEASVSQSVTWSVRLSLSKGQGTYNVSYGQYAIPGK
jgi:hypothetical protein